MTARELHERIKARFEARGEVCNGILIADRWFTYESDKGVRLARACIKEAGERGLPIPFDALDRAYPAVLNAIEFVEANDLADHEVVTFIRESVIAVFEP